MKIIYINVAAAALLLGSCASWKQIHTDYSPQKIVGDSVIRQEFLSDTTQTVALQQWREFYKDPQLQRLISKALENNSDLRKASLKIEEAEASLQQSKRTLGPSADISATGSVSKFGSNSATKTYSIGPEVSWTADIIGKLNNNKKAALATVEERQYAAQAVQVELNATVAADYYTLETLDAKIKVTENTVASWKEYIQTEKALMKAGEADESDVAQAEASLLSTETTVETLRQQVKEMENSLCGLIGIPATTISRGSLDDANLSTDLLHGINAQLLANRPDVQEAEAALKAAYYNTNVARAAFWPSLTLSGSAGWTNNGGIVVNPGKLLLQAAASLTQPLLSQGQNEANLKIAKAQQQETAISWQQAVLDAGNAVNNNLQGWQSASARIEKEKQQITKLEETLRATRAKMRYGTTNYLQVIIARQSLLSAQLNMLADRYEVLDNYILLYQNLGGGKE